MDPAAIQVLVILGAAVLVSVVVCFWASIAGRQQSTERHRRCREQFEAGAWNPDSKDVRVHNTNADQVIWSLDNEPEKWSATHYVLQHENGLQLWIANGFEYLSDHYLSQYPVHFSQRDKCRVWHAFEKWNRGNVVRALKPDPKHGPPKPPPPCPPPPQEQTSPEGVKWMPAEDYTPAFTNPPREGRGHFESHRVLVVALGTVLIGHWAVFLDKPESEGKWCDSNGYLLHGVTHWAELPKPP